MLSMAQGVTHAFGVPGESYLAVLDGFHAHAGPDPFCHLSPGGRRGLHGRGAGQADGAPRCLFRDAGPGATNASIGVHTAFQDSTPMVLFVGDVASDTRDREAFQEVDFCSFFGPEYQGHGQARGTHRRCPRRIPEYVARAFATAMNGRPGPVVLVLPEDMLTQAVDARVLPLPRVEAGGGLERPGSAAPPCASCC
jgi:acetolactate synthase-1/2/3 large subunit